MSGHPGVHSFRSRHKARSMRGTLQTSRRLCTELSLPGPRRQAAQKLFLTRRIFKLSPVVCPVVCACGNGLERLAANCLMAMIIWLSLMTTTGIAFCNYQVTTIASVSPFRLKSMQGQNSCGGHRTKFNLTLSESSQSMHLHDETHACVVAELVASAFP